MNFTTSNRKLATALAGAAIASLTVASGASAEAGYQDLRSPDARYGADSAQPRDLRSPDARDAAAAATSERDLRSPDARDAGAGYRPAPAPRTASAAPSALSEPSGVDWVSVALGGAAGTGMLLVLMAFGPVRGSARQRRGAHRA